MIERGIYCTGMLFLSVKYYPMPCQVPELYFKHFLVRLFATLRLFGGTDNYL